MPVFSFDKRVDRQLTKAVERLLKVADSNDGLIPIVTAGEPVLRANAQRYAGQLGEKTLARLIAAMRVTMLAAPGVGLAAPQIGLPLAFAVVEDHARAVDEEVSYIGRLGQADKGGSTEDGADPEADELLAADDDPREITDFPFHVIVNPSYLPAGPDTRSFYEGCLSVPGFQAVRKRWLDITATWQDEVGTRHEERLHGWPARIFQHETDHLSGELYIDKAELRSLTSDENLDEYWWEPMPAEAAERLGFKL